MRGISDYRCDEAILRRHGDGYVNLIEMMNPLILPRGINLW